MQIYCSYVCAYHCEQLSCMTIKHRTVPIIVSLTFRQSSKLRWRLLEGDEITVRDLQGNRNFTYSKPSPNVISRTIIYAAITTDNNAHHLYGTDVFHRLRIQQTDQCMSKVRHTVHACAPRRLPYAGAIAHVTSDRQPVLILDC